MFSVGIDINSNVTMHQFVAELTGLVYYNVHEDIRGL
jgi:hypothetical protein